MLTTDNFVSFFTICGFFIGLIFSLINSLEPFDFLLYTLLITFVFYILIHIIAMSFVDFTKTKKQTFNKDNYESVSDYFISELQNRERKIDYLLEQVNSKPIKLKTKKKNATTQAKAA